MANDNHLVGLLDTIDGLYKKYNAFLEEHGYELLSSGNLKTPEEPIV